MVFKSSFLTCKRLTLLMLAVVSTMYLLSIDWTLSDRVIREFGNARERDTIRIQVFGGKMNWLVSVNQPIKDLLPLGTPRGKIVSALGDTFDFQDVTHSRPNLRDGFIKAFGDFDTVLCGSYEKGYLFSDSYSLCLVFADDVLVGVDARAVYQYF